MRVKQLLGKKVFDSEAKAIGKITDAEIREDTFSITAVEVSQGIVKKTMIDTRLIAKLGDSVFLSVPLEQAATALPPEEG